MKETYNKCKTQHKNEVLTNELTTKRFPLLPLICLPEKFGLNTTCPPQIEVLKPLKHPIFSLPETNTLNFLTFPHKHHKVQYLNQNIHIFSKG